MSCFSQLESLVVHLLARASSTAVACFTVLHHRVLAGCQADPKCFRVTEKAVMRQLARAALDAGRDAELSGEAAGSAVKLASLVQEAATTNPLWSLSDELPLCQCMT